MIDWTDDTSYQRGERDGGAKPEPRVWGAKIGRLRLVVHRLHGIPGLWYCSAEPFWSQHQLQAKTDVGAKLEAEALLRNEISGIVNRLGGWSGWKEKR
jgi:hypothetical protein